MQNDKKPLIVFLAIVFGASAVVEAIWIVFGEAATQTGISTLLMMIPFIAAVIVGRKFYKKQGALGFKRCKPVYILFAVGIPLLYLALSYGLFWGLFKGSHTGSLSALIEIAATFSGQELPGNTAIVISLVVMLPITIITALGEEAGWRGFMCPIMQRLWG